MNLNVDFYICMPTFQLLNVILDIIKVITFNTLPTQYHLLINNFILWEIVKFIATIFSFILNFMIKLIRVKDISYSSINYY